MARPTRNANSHEIARSERIFFATTRTSMGSRLFQSERNADLLVDVLRSYVAAARFKLHDFVIMPDHVHLLLTVHDDMTIEKAMQLIKSGFSYRLKNEFSYLGEVWQMGFSEVRINNDKDFLQFRNYIAQNPVKARLVDAPENYPYCFTYLSSHKQTGAKAPIH